MSCCDPNVYDEEDIAGQCPECGEDIDEYGDALDGCHYSPVYCEKCGHRPCDLSC